MPRKGKQVLQCSEGNKHSKKYDGRKKQVLGEGQNYNLAMGENPVTEDYDKKRWREEQGGVILKARIRQTFRRPRWLKHRKSLQQKNSADS